MLPTVGECSFRSSYKASSSLGEKEGKNRTIWERKTTKGKTRHWEPIPDSYYHHITFIQAIISDVLTTLIQKYVTKVFCIYRKSFGNLA